MEVKLIQNRDLFPLTKFLLPNLPTTTFTSLSKSSFHKHFRGLTQRWRFRIQEVSKGQHSTKHYLVHVVKEGETLTSISKQYGVSVYAIAAANKSVVDIDLVFKGQHLNIPSVTGDTQVALMSWLPAFKMSENHLGPFNILDGLVHQKSFTVLSSHFTTHAKTTGYFLVLVPLIAFCIRCVIGAFHTRVAGELRHQDVNKSEGQHHGSRSMRWKYALSDIREPDTLDAESSPDSNSHSEDQSQVSFEEASHAYSKLENDYQKFLSECGMTERGYWRGGSSE